MYNLFSMMKFDKDMDDIRDMIESTANEKIRDDFQKSKGDSR